MRAERLFTKADHMGYYMTPRLITVGRRVMATPRPDKGKGRKQLLKHKTENCEERHCGAVPFC